MSVSHMIENIAHENWHATQYSIVKIEPSVEICASPITTEIYLI